MAGHFSDETFRQFFGGTTTTTAAKVKVEDDDERISFTIATNANSFQYKLSFGRVTLSSLWRTDPTEYIITVATVQFKTIVAIRLLPFISRRFLRCTRILALQIYYYHLLIYIFETESARLHSIVLH